MKYLVTATVELYANDPAQAVTRLQEVLTGKCQPDHRWAVIPIDFATKEGIRVDDRLIKERDTLQADNTLLRLKVLELERKLEQAADEQAGSSCGDGCCNGLL